MDSSNTVYLNINIKIMSEKTKALMAWLQALTETEIREINDLRDGRLMAQALTKIEELPISSSSKDLSERNQNYNQLKTIYQHANEKVQKNSKISLPELSYMNLIKMAQGQQEDGLENLLHLVFIVCIQSPIRNEFVPYITKLQNSFQSELMFIIQESCATDREEDDERDKIIEQYKQAIAKLQFAYNNLVTENEGLRTVLLEDDEKNRKHEDMLDDLKNQNQRLARQLLQKDQFMIKAKEEFLLQKFGTGNEELVEELKKQMLERQQNYGRQILDLNQKIREMKDQLSDARKNHLELMEEQSTRKLIQGRMDHSNCIAIEKHKAKVNQMLAQSKESTQKEMTAKLQNVKLKNQNAELQSKNKRLNEEVHKKNQDFMINRGDANKLKVEFFSKIRDSLKAKLQEFKPRNEAEGEAVFLDNE